jgi:hypothetical protein
VNAQRGPDPPLATSWTPEGGGRYETIRLAQKSSSGTKARRAADALANGSYAEALQMYDELRSDKDANPAYEQAARTLRARLAQSTSTTP